MQNNYAASNPSFAHALADRIDPPKTGIRAYRDDPAGFVRDCIKWKPGEKPAPYQLSNLEALVKHNRVCVRGPRGLGKTTTNSWAILWFALTRDACGEDWKIAATAPVYRQLTEVLWPELKRWARRLDWELIGREPLSERTELLESKLKLKHGQAFTVASNDPAKTEGVHADQVLYLYDEAKAIPAEIFDSSEGAFSGHGVDSHAEAFALASSTPGEPNGRFYEIQSRMPGYESWHSIVVTLEETIAAGLVSNDFAERMKAQWGEDSSLYQTHVLGKFAASQQDSVIPLAWVEAAVLRYERLKEAGKLQNGPFEAVGVDVANEGEDKTVFALRHGLVISEIQRYANADLMETAGRVKALISNSEARAIVDSIGEGGGVYSSLRQEGANVISFKASRKSRRRDSTGDYKFKNCRADAWWRMRELLHPHDGADIALPPDNTLIGDLVAPKWKVTSSGEIQIEAKDDIKKRLGRSTDDGDAVIQAFWEEQKPLLEIF